MKPCLRRSLALLGLWIFGAIRIGYGQTTDSEFLRTEGRAEYLAGRFERAETLLLNALVTAQSKKDEYVVARVQNDLGVLYQKEERLAEAERDYRERQN